MAPVQASLFDDPAPEVAQATLDDTQAPEVDPRQISLFSLLDEDPAPVHGGTPATPIMSSDIRVTPAPRVCLEDQFEALPVAWRDLLQPFLASDTCAPLCQFVDDERAAGKTVYPADVFRALRLTSPDDVKVVILGQDPYHGEDRGTPQAHGLAFSVPPGVRPPPSLRNIFKEIAASLGIEAPQHGCLDAWARQGVLLLNAVLTVRENSPLSHRDKGWEIFTDAVISALNKRERPVVFLLWGAQAQKKAALITNPRHHILKAAHPSPLSAYAGFFGCGHFARTNAILAAAGEEGIVW